MSAEFPPFDKQILPEARATDRPPRSLEEQQHDAAEFAERSTENIDDQERIRRFTQEARIRRIAYETDLITAEEFDLLTGRLMAEKDHGKEIDELTDLYRKEAFYRRLHEQTSHARTNRAPLTVAFLDLDDFSRINAAPYSHFHGDAVLNQVASYLTSRFRRGTDIVGRYGGEEIGIILPYTTEGKALEYLEEIHAEMPEVIREAVTGMNLHPHLARNIQITGSIGVAQVDFSDQTVDPFTNGMRALKKADNRMILGKNHGKNQIVGSQRERELRQHKGPTQKK